MTRDERLARIVLAQRLLAEAAEAELAAAGTSLEHDEPVPLDVDRQRGRLLEALDLVSDAYERGFANEPANVRP